MNRKVAIFPISIISVLMMVAIVGMVAGGRATLGSAICVVYCNLMPGLPHFLSWLWRLLVVLYYTSTLALKWQQQETRYF